MSEPGAAQRTDHAATQAADTDPDALADSRSDAQPEADAVGDADTAGEENLKAVTARATVGD